MTERSPLDTRERILAAAAMIIAEDGVTARLSVRAVSARAGVSIGSMRHHFPTQQQLRDRVMERIGDWLAPAEWMLDASLPAHQRLLRSLRQVLAQAGAGQQARDAMLTTISTFVAVEQTPAVRESYLSIESDGQRRIEGWLNTLADEGFLSRSEVPRHARFLGTVLKGLALQRALPAIDALSQAEEETLATAVSAVLQNSTSAE
ncbi:TetR/AcrR family transcriptional regulator [Streptomonospora salina]|uniref:AcrR family transcriptional regulator n=1 Tax=Streptomonospora salina TaxID=104205 RepID=A0A841EA91_9ACTN|nr:TetR/AcrR family transcriptional regulator [Streptomonospora salina]MBB5999926.1 AcrR family transcriptional regulator [Streptomonospora salina]